MNYSWTELNWKKPRLPVALLALVAAGITSGRPGLAIKDHMGVSRQNKCFISQYFQKTSENNTHTGSFHCTGPFIATAQPLPNLMSCFPIAFSATSHPAWSQSKGPALSTFIELFSLLKSTMTVMAKADFIFLQWVCLPMQNSLHNSIQDDLYSAFYDTIIAKQLYRKISFNNIFIYIVET